jgi:ornithine carbamoyltransferase
MPASLTHRHFTQELHIDDVQALLHAARKLKLAERAQAVEPLLRGKNIAVLCKTPECSEALSFEIAAKGLGARVSRVPADKALARDEASDCGPAARMLGRLYDALECDDLNDDLAARLEKEAGIPVFNGLSSIDHPLRRLLQRQSDEPSDADALTAEDQRYLLQAMLLSALG